MLSSIKDVGGAVGTATIPKPTYTQAQVDASLAANPNASKGGYEGPTPMPPQYVLPSSSAPSTTSTSTSTGAPYTPDYKSLIQNDPAYIQAQDANTAATGAATAARRAKLRSLYIQYGGNLPSDFADTYGDLDQATKDAASQNQNSTIAQLMRNYSQSMEQFKRQLAARGALQSSDLNYGEDQLQRGLDQQQYDAGNQFLSGVNDAYGAYTGVVNADAQNLSSAIGQAESNVYSNPAYRPYVPISASYDAGTSASYGQPVYTDDQQNKYDINGNPITSPPVVAPVTYDPGAVHVPGAQLE